MTSLAFVNVDLDPIPCYRAIHGLSGSCPARDRHAVMERAVDRFIDLFRDLGVKATFFVVGEDAEEAVGRRAVERMVAAGHEIGNHSYSHPYNLIKLTPARREDELRRAHEVLSSAAGAEVDGFRAPGYNISDAMVDDLLRLGYRYSSSVLPSPPYYLARASVIGLYGLLGRRSKSIVGNVRHAFSGTTPFYHERPQGGRRLLEIPVGVAPVGRIPLVGTFMTMFGPRLSWLLAESTRGMGFVNIEFHGVDLLSIDDDGLDPALAAQKDLLTPVRTKRAIYERFIATVAERAEVVTLGTL